MTFEEIVNTAEEMQCLLYYNGDGRFTLYAGDKSYDHSVCWIYPMDFNGKGLVSSTYDFP